MRNRSGVAQMRAAGRVWPATTAVAPAWDPASVWALAMIPALALGLMLTGCADDTQTAAPPAAAAASAPAAPPQTAAMSPAQAAPAAGASDAADVASLGAMLTNDPSAPTNTPLCGIAAQETNAISRQLLPRRYAEAGQCTSYACYDAATATYIGADGYRHVCR